MARIQHIVVVMFENRSFDNIVGWLYHAEGNQAPINLPPRTPPTYDGLTPDLWNPGVSQQPVYVHQGTSGANPWLVPSPDPQELFDHMKIQLFQTPHPVPGQAPTMDGFVQDYATVANNSAPNAIMECFLPEQVPVISTLARNYAICDRWFASVPCQTWPNRAFVHTGSSCGRVDNCDGDQDDCIPDPRHYDARTIFEFLEDVGATWKVYNDSVLMSLTRTQFATRLGDPLLEGHFRSFGDFKRDAQAGTLPAYSFIEPSFVWQPNDQHPPHDVRAGEAFLYDVWMAVSRGKNWTSTLLVITYDEHGGCYDHVPPPGTAVAPDNSPPQQPFDFRRFGVRVPTVLVSPYIEAGTVFRSGTSVEYDHTAILATLRDWVDPTGAHADRMPASARIKAAPTLGTVLTRTAARTDLPEIPPLPQEIRQLALAAMPPETPLNSIQKAVIAASVTRHRGAAFADAAIRTEMAASLRTHADALRAVQELL